MTSASNLTVPKVNVMNEVAVVATGLKALVGRKMTKKVKFMDSDLLVSKLSVAEVMDIQERAKELGDAEDSGLVLLQLVISSAVEGGKDMSPEDFQTFPMDELTKLSNEIMKFSGIDGSSSK
jgi:hypothetical protein